MGVVVARGTLTFAQDLDARERGLLTLQAGAKFAISLPRVVGLAGCPCVRANIAVAACPMGDLPQ